MSAEPIPTHLIRMIMSTAHTRARTRTRTRTRTHAHDPHTHMSHMRARARSRLNATVCVCPTGMSRTQHKMTIYTVRAARADTRTLAWDTGITPHGGTQRTRARREDDYFLLLVGLSDCAIVIVRISLA